MKEWFFSEPTHQNCSIAIKRLSSRGLTCDTGLVSDGSSAFMLKVSDWAKLTAALLIHDSPVLLKCVLWSALTCCAGMKWRDAPAGQKAALIFISEKQQGEEWRSGRPGWRGGGGGWELCHGWFFSLFDLFCRRLVHFAFRVAFLPSVALQRNNDSVGCVST